MFKFTKLKKHHNSGFFILVTTSLMLIVITVNIFSNLALSLKNFNNNQDLIIEKIKNILTIKDIDVDLSFEEIKGDFLNSANPLTTVIGIQVFEDNNIKDLYQSLKFLTKKIKPLLDYKFGEQGFENIYSSKKNFTDDLDIFFESSKDTLDSIENTWNKLWYYKLLFRLTANIKLQQLIELVDIILDAKNTIIPYKNQILYILGHFSTRNIVIFNQNVGEARPTGGFIGSYIPIEIFKGRVKIQQSQSIYHISDNIRIPQLTHPANWYYGYDASSSYGGVQNTNYFPCFSDTAEYLENQFSTSSTGFSIDTVIFVTPKLIQNLLPDNFTLKINEDLTLNSSNLIEQIERLTSIEAKNKSNVKQDIGLIFDKILSILPQIAERSGFQNFLQIIANSVHTRDLQIWFKNKLENDFYNLFINTNQNLCLNQEFNLIPLIANISGDKRNLLTQNNFNLYVTKNLGSTTVHMGYTQILPEKPLLQRSFNEPYSFTFVGLQIPKSASNLKIFSEQSLPVTAKRPYYEQNVESLKGYKPQTPKKIETVLSTIRDLDSQNGFTYIQPNGSTVMGIYVADKLITKVEFSFEVPTNQKFIDFYGQPGLNESSFSFGKNAHFSESSRTRVITNPEIIQKGIKVRFD